MSSPKIADNYEKVRILFAAAFDLAPEKRAEFLQLTDEAETVVNEVKSLLDSCAEAGEFLNDVSAADSVRDSLERRDRFIGQTIDKYRIEREIGRGGMGVVFLATREDFQQQTALKIIKRGMDSDAILERFRREREILAALNHPFIARLLDGGTTNEGLPYFVLELVEGLPLDEYCKTNNLPETEKLQLFRKICEALIFAHQKLIVHRDLKPSNILVTADGTPKLLDFGIAKLLDSTAEETQTNMRVLTPKYASPEQMRGETIDTRTDVYSLGVILSEILDVPDLKLRTQNLKTAPTRRLNSDLRNILAVSLREDAARRYGSVEKFSEDIRRYLNGLPVSARRDTFSYRAAKFFKRNRLAAAVSVLFVLTMLVGITATFWQARKAEQERAIAERRLENLRKMSDSFTTEIHGAIENLPGSLPARRMLMRHAVEQLDALAAESDANPILRDELAQAYLNSTNLPDMPLSEKDATLRKEIEIYRRLAAENPSNIHYREEAALGYASLGDITKVRGSLVGALENYRTSVEILEKIVESEPQSVEHRVNLADALSNTSNIYNLEGDLENAVRLSSQTAAAIEEIRKINPLEPELTALDNQLKIQVSIEQTNAGNYEPAINSLQKLRGEYEKQLAGNANDTRINYYLWVINRRLGVTFDKGGDSQNALKYMRISLSIIENLLAGSPQDFGYHRNSAATQILDGEMLIRQKQTAAALDHFRRAVELSDFVLENDIENSEAKTDLARAESDIGNALVLTGKKREGADYLQKAYSSLQELFARDTANAELKRTYLQTADWLETVSR